MKQRLLTFEDLECWRAGRDLRLFATEVCKRLPKDEQYRMKDQLLRSARSVTANIAEGYGRFHYQETVQFCRHARGSAYETLDHLITATDEGLCDKEALDKCRTLVECCIALLNGYIRYLIRCKTGKEDADS